MIGTRPDLGMGRSNTLAIVNVCSQKGTAARICNDLVFNGYDDWFLPSRYELYLMCTFQNDIGGFDPFSVYWNSTEEDSENAIGLNIGYMDGDPYPKQTKLRVRAIRAF